MLRFFFQRIINPRAKWRSRSIPCGEPKPEPLVLSAEERQILEGWGWAMHREHVGSEIAQHYRRHRHWECLRSLKLIDTPYF
jgi:hypothetical protein